MNQPRRSGRHLRAIVGGRSFALLLCHLALITGAANSQQVVLPSPGVIDTLAGNHVAGYVDGPVGSAEFDRPYGMALDSAGNIYIADFENSAIRKVTVSTGVVSTVAGGGTVCTWHTDSVGDGCPATEAIVAAPGSVALDSTGNIYIADYGSNRLRVVNTQVSQTIMIAGVSIQPGYIEAIAGNGTQAEAGDNGPADGSGVELYGPSGVAVDSSNNIYIADAGGNRVRAINPKSSGTVTIATISIPAGYIKTIAGGTTVCTSPPHDAFGNGCLAILAELFGPAGVALDTSGNIYIADEGHQEVRMVMASTGYISQFAGNGTGYHGGDGGPATSAYLNQPYRVAVDASRNVYIADSENNSIREVTASNGYIWTVAGGYSLGSGYSGDGGAATSAQLDFPAGVAVDNNDNIYIGDSFNNVIRVVGGGAIVDLDGGTLTGSTSGLSESGAIITQYNNLTGTLGTVPFSTGSLTSGSLQMGGTFNGGGSVVVTTNGSDGTLNGVDFSGAFSGTVTWTLVTLANGTHDYTLTGNIADSNGYHPGVLQLIINTGKGFYNGSTTLSSVTLTFQ
jgi:hypothetical protein